MVEFGFKSDSAYSDICTARALSPVTGSFSEDNCLGLGSDLKYRLEMAENSVSLACARIVHSNLRTLLQLSEHMERMSRQPYRQSVKSTTNRNAPGKMRRLCASGAESSPPELA